MTNAKETLSRQRVQSVDFIRGLVMILMVIDHVRVFSGQPAGGPDAGIFLTRWVTHFCAPVFVFLAGTSIYLYKEKLNDLTKIRKYLISRGIILIIADLTIMRFSWTFNFDYGNFLLTNIIWTIGWSMIIMSLLIQLNPKLIGIIGLAVILFQNILGYIPGLIPESMAGTFNSIWSFIYSINFSGPWGIAILYVLVPWIGVMAAGYGLGSIFKYEESKRKRQFILIGTSAIAMFIIFGTIKVIMAAPDSTPFLFRLLAQQKYPASQLFLLMTLGPAILGLAFTENVKGGMAKSVVTIGKVPFFFYLLHIPLIHLTAFMVQMILFGRTIPELYNTAPFIEVGEEFRWSLSILYLVFIVDTVILYIACRWYESFKFNNPLIKWLKYV